MDVRYAFSIIPLFFLALLFASPLTADTILDDFQVNIEPPGHPPQKSPYTVARWSSETIHVTWLSQRDGANWDVACNRFDYDLEPLGDAFYLNIRTGTDACQQPRLVLSAAGCGAAWIEEATPNRIMFRSYDDNGNPFSQPVSVAEEIADETKDNLSIAALGDGYLLIWYDERFSSLIYAQKVDFEGNLLGINFPIREYGNGSILGLEAQNHPDGRVLVSWVTNQQYSRGRWLDNTGSFMGDVFEMAEAFVDISLCRSLVRFNTNGTGLLLQYSETEEWISAFLTECASYTTHLDESGLQEGEKIRSWWYSEWGDLSWGTTQHSFPDIISLPDQEHASKYSYYSHGYTQGSGFFSYMSNTIFSSIYGYGITPWGYSYEGHYDLCQISAESFLYSFSINNSLGLRSYQISNLDSSENILWISEPNVAASQSFSDIGVHDNGSFRVIYANDVGPDYHIYTRHFANNGIPSGLDTLVSMDTNYNPVYTYIGSILSTAVNDNMLVVWRYAGEALGTFFDQDSWCGNVQSFGCSPGIAYGYWPQLDINATNHVLIAWTNEWEIEPGLWQWDSYFNHFMDIFNSTGPAIKLNYGFWDMRNPSVAVRDEGRFLVCAGYSEVEVQSGIEYRTLIGESLSSGIEKTGQPILKKTPIGYILAWLAYDQVYLWRFDADGNPISEPEVVISDDALVLGNPAMAASDSS